MEKDGVLQKTAETYEAAGRLDPAGFDRNIVFATFAPPVDLQPFVAHFWVIRWSRRNQPPYLSEQVMHRPYVDLFLSEAESGIQCTFRGRKTYKAEGEGRIVGARFLPGAFHAFWPGPMAGLHDQNLGLGEFIPEAESGWVQETLSGDDGQAIKSMADQLQAKHPQPDFNIELVNQIIDAIEQDDSLVTVPQIASQFLRSERWIQNLFSQYVGVGLKWFLQRSRLLKAARFIREQAKVDWATLAYDLGYSSQQHFNADFKQVMGKTPVQYQHEITPNRPS